MLDNRIESNRQLMPAGGHDVPNKPGPARSRAYPTATLAST